MSRKGEKVKCDCPRCRGVATADPKWGFDRTKVPALECMSCGKRIGQEPYVLETGLARFGKMEFQHERCAGETDKQRTKKPNDMKTKSKGKAEKAVRLVKSASGMSAVQMDGEAARQEPRPTVAVGELVQAARSAIAVVRNVRKTFNQAKLDELADSIRVHGILQPLVVRPMPRFTLQEPDLVCNDWLIKDAGGNAVANWPGWNEGMARAELEARNKHAYELVAGERRLRAAEIAGLAQVPCMVRAMTDAEVRAIHRIENLQREDITALEEAQGFRDWMDEEQITADQVAERIKKSRSHVFARLKLLKLSEPVRQAVLSGKVSQSIAELIARVPGEKQQKAVLKRIADGARYEDEPMSFRQAKRLVDEEWSSDLKKAPWDLKDGTLDAAAGPCTDCPKRSANCKDLFPEITGPDVCTDVACYQAKAEAHGARVVAAAKEGGTKVLEGKAAEGLFESTGRLKWNSGYVDLAEKEWDVSSGKTYKALLGKHAAGAQVVVATPGGETLQLVKKNELQDLLKAAGVKKKQSTNSWEVENRKRQAKCKELRPVAKAVAVKAVEAIAGLKSKRDLVEWLVAHTVNYWDAREWNETAYENERTFDAWLGKAEESALLGLLVRRAVGDGVEYHGKFSEGLLELAEVCKVDVKAVEKGMAKPEKIEQKATKGTKKGGKK